MGAYKDVETRKAEARARTQAEIDRRQTMERQSTAVRQPNVSASDFARASMIDRIARRNQGR